MRRDNVAKTGNTVNNCETSTPKNSETVHIVVVLRSDLYVDLLQIRRFAMYNSREKQQLSHFWVNCRIDRHRSPSCI